MASRRHTDTKGFDELVAANVAHLIAMECLKDVSVSKKSIARAMGVTPTVLSHLLHQDGQRARRWLAFEMFGAAKALGVSLDRLVRPIEDD
jgi:plasmid maintenance system antidote protein VapI